MSNHISFGMIGGHPPYDDIPDFSKVEHVLGEIPHSAGEEAAFARAEHRSTPFERRLGPHAPHDLHPRLPGK